jgi:hypothetical protein
MPFLLEDNGIDSPYTLRDDRVEGHKPVDGRGGGCLKDGQEIWTELKAHRHKERMKKSLSRDDHQEARVDP